MKLITQIKQSNVFIELESNKRLQWLSLAVVAILMLSILKTLSDRVSDFSNEVESQIELVSRLERTANSDIDESSVLALNDRFNDWLTSLPEASSASTAEAQALTRVNARIKPYIDKARLNLVGSELRNFGSVQVWQVRVNITGKLPKEHVIDFMSFLDRSHKAGRLVSLQYSPKASHTANLVVDLMYKEAPNE